jgi:uncharacterized delta-60 repeat protein
MIASRKALIVVAALFALSLGLPWGGTVQTASAQVSVSAADPNTGEQGTLNLSVLIKGKGFKNGAKAKWFKTGTTDPAGVNVKSTQYVSSTQLIATIDIADAAALSLFDIQVQNADGRTGKGTGLFSVVAKRIDPCTLSDPEPSLSSYTSGLPGLPGYFDATFGSNGTGKVIGPRHFQVGTLGYGPSLAIQNVSGQARIVVVGSSQNVCVSNSQPIGVVARYLLDGALDPAFGSGGVATTGSVRIRSVAIQPDSKIVVVGSAPYSKTSSLPTVVRFNVDGSPDTTFGTSGVVTLTIPGKSASGTLYTVAVQSDGKIVAAGSAVPSSGYGYMVRLYPNGTVDTSFKAYAGPFAMFSTVRIQRFGSGDERVVIAGAAHDSYGQLTATVWRFTSSGAPDTSFGGTGMIVTSFHGDMNPWFSDSFNDLAIDSSNRIVAAGLTGYYPSGAPSESQLALARYDTSGNLDSSFGIAGRVLAPSGQAHGVGNATAIQPDGRILVAGYSYDYGAITVGVWRFNADGTVDATFGNVGWIPDSVVDGKRVGYWMGMALQPDGRIVCGGYVLMESDPAIYYAVLARFWQ